MKTGIELITEERQEQINKHGFSLEFDAVYYKNKELVQAAKYCLMLAGFIQGSYYWPRHWDAYFEQKAMTKTKIGQLVEAGAFLMAENERRKDNFWDEYIQEIAAEIDKFQTNSQ